MCRQTLPTCWRKRCLVAALALVICGCSGQTRSTAPTPAVPHWAISGSVHGEMGAPIGGATVSISAFPPSFFTARATTDTTGRYSFPSVEQGTYFVGASAGGYVSEFFTVTLTATQTVDFTL